MYLLKLNSGTFVILKHFIEILNSKLGLIKTSKTTQIKYD